MKKFLTALALMFVGSFSLALAACAGNGNKIQVSFDVNGGTEISTVQLDKGEEYTLPVPERDGYEFEGWYVSGEFTGSTVTGVTASENVTYFAKWSKLYTVTFNTAGGTLSTSSLQLKEGANLYDAVKNVVPTKSDYQFDAWLNGASAVALNSKMPAQDVALTARYKVKYTVELYKQNADGTAYEKEETDVIGYGYVDETLTPEVSAEDTVGFTAATSSDAVTSLTLSATASENVFKLYYDRETYSVTFHANYPDGKDTIIKTESVKYGAEVGLPTEVTANGYCLAGWALSASGEIAYEVDAVTGKLFNASADASVTAASFKPDRDMGLYAVWTKGYTDMFGGSDVIFLFDEADTKAYLNRNDKYFVGSYKASNNMVTFEEEENDIYFEGKLCDDGTFVYFDDVRSVAAYDNYKITLEDGELQQVIDNTVQLHFDGFNGITYTVTGSSGLTSSSNGTFVLDENGYYVSKFTDGELAGQTLVIMLREVATGVNTSTPAFSVRNEDELALGTIYCAMIKGGDIVYYNSLFSITFNGFNTATYIDESSVDDYISFLDGDELILANQRGIFLQAKLIELGDMTGYIEYEAKYDFAATNGSDVLNLDGCGRATYKTAAGEQKGYYEATSSGFGDYVVKFMVNFTESATFVVSNTAAAEEEPVYTFTKKLLGYAEYNYADEYIYPGVYLVLNEETAGTAAIYATDEEGNKVKVSTGTWESVNGLYVYTKTTWSASDDLEIPFPVKDFSSFVFTAQTTRAQNYVTYTVDLWVEYKVDDATTKLYTEYTSGEDVLGIIEYAQTAIYKAKNSSEYVIGSYTVSDGVYTVTTDLSYMYFTVNADEKTFERLDFAPYDLISLDASFNENENVYISLSGKVTLDSVYFATYNVVDGEETTSISGKITFDNVEYIYTFTSDDGNTTLKYKMFTAGTTQYISFYDDTYAQRYVSADGILVLDGYGSSATLNGTSYMYAVVEENVIAMISSSGDIYADLDVANKSFTLRDDAYGTYIFNDNQYFNGYYFEFDGYGKLSVFTISEDSEERVYVDENGEYEYDGDVVRVKYTSGTTQIDRLGYFGSFKYNSYTYKTFGFTYGEIANTYVSKSDWSVITLDKNGNATKYNTDGQVEYGTYTIVTENLFYYLNDDSTDAAIYKIDAVTGTATPLALRARGYYTSEMESLLFSKYGFAIFNGSTRYYYDIVNNEVFIYRHAEEGESGANAYGYIKESIGSFANKIDYGGKTYHYNEGYNITFNRVESDKTKYPINVGTEEDPEYVYVSQLIFTPSGDDEEYSVDGIAVIEGTNCNCTVRRFIDDGEASYYVILDNLVFTVSLTYGGLTEDELGNEVSASTFTVSELASMDYYYSQEFLWSYFVYQMIYGITIPNTWGSIQIVAEYGEDGKIAEEYVYASFGEDSNAYDANGELFVVEAPYEYDEKTGLYIVTFDHDDGFTYVMAFSVGDFLDYPAYTLYYINRVQTIEAGDYTVEVQTVITTDSSSLSRGMVFDLKLIKGEDEISFDTAFSGSDYIYYVSRTLDEQDKITATQYYKLEFSYADVEEDFFGVHVYTQVTVTELEGVTTYYDEAGTSYVDVDTVNNTVLSVCIYDEEAKEVVEYSVTSCEYADSTSSYTVTLSSGNVYTVKIENGKVTLTQNSAIGGSSSESGEAK